MSKAKKKSSACGDCFLRTSFAAEQNVLQSRLKLSSVSITHDGVLGDVNESILIEVLRRYLPERYAIDSAIVIDSTGKTSDQIDIVIYDHQYTPTFLDQKDHKYVLAESVYAVFEAKPEINKNYISYAADKAASVRNLKRTSARIVHAGGCYPPKPLIPILAGIIGVDAGWKGGLSSTSFSRNLAKLSGLQVLNCGIALSDRCFDFYGSILEVSDKDNSLAVFLFRLLEQLQSMGTVPAPDWGMYASLFR